MFVQQEIKLLWTKLFNNKESVAWDSCLDTLFLILTPYSGVKKRKQEVSNGSKVKHASRRTAEEKEGFPGTWETRHRPTASPASLRSAAASAGTSDNTAVETREGGTDGGLAHPQVP